MFRDFCIVDMQLTTSDTPFNFAAFTINCYYDNNVIIIFAANLHDK